MLYTFGQGLRLWRGDWLLHGTVKEYQYIGKTTYNGKTAQEYKVRSRKIIKTEVWDRGSPSGFVVGFPDSYILGSPSAIDSDGFWYEKGDIAPRYTLYKYDQNLVLKSTYDVDTKTLTTAPIDISNKGRNKIKLTLTTTGSDYKTYISNDSTNWQEVTDIASGTPKGLYVAGWDKLYVKVETNTSRIDNIDIAYYKD